VEGPVTPPPAEAGPEAVGDRRLLRSQYQAVKNLISGRGAEGFAPLRRNSHFGFDRGLTVWFGCACR
jgi:hypothetical protein